VEPDVLLTFDRSAVIIEAKLWSGKSPSASGIDQLARQWMAGCEWAAPRSHHIAALIFLTAGLSAPTKDLEETVDAMEGREHPPIRLWWLSWATLLPLLAEIPDNPVASDLARYLREAGVARFLRWPEISTTRVSWNYRAFVVPDYWQGLTPPLSFWRYGTPKRAYWCAFLSSTKNKQQWSYRSFG
jgi:hypothetical protein